MKKRSGALAAAAAAALITAGSAQADWVIKGIAGKPGSSGTQVLNYASADNLINGTNGFTNAPGFPAVLSLPYWNTADIGGSPGGQGVFKTNGSGDRTDVPDIRPPGLTGGDQDDYVVVGSGIIHVDAGGGPTNFKFTTNSDDGSRLIIDGTQVITDNVLSGDHDASGTISLSDGPHTINWMGYERGGGGQHEISYESPDLGTTRTILAKAGTGLPGPADGSLNGITLDNAAIVTTYKSVVTGVVGSEFQNDGATNLAHAIAAAHDPSRVADGSAVLKTFNLSNDGAGATPGQSGRFGGDSDVPGIPRDRDNYIAVGTGKLIIPADGDYYFDFLSDDGNQLSIDGVAVIHDETQHGAGPGVDDRFSGAVHLTAGLHDIEAIFFENGGGSGGEVQQTNAAHTTFCVLGADDCLQLAAVPEPTSLGLLSLGAIGLLARRRKA